MSNNPLKNTFSRNIRNFLFGSLGSTVVIFTLGKTLFKVSVIQSALMGIVFLIILFSIRFLYYLCKDLVRYIHNVYVDSIWGDAIIELKDAYSILHYLRRQDEISDEDFMKALVTFCETLKNIFDRKTKGNCCVSIKVPTGVFNSLQTWELCNLCRDKIHSSRDTKDYEAISHTVIGNTPYIIIVNKLLDTKRKSKPYYINNDIENTKDYVNTSIDVYKDGLPYKSELVYAIVPVKNDEDHRHDLAGFLCVDCDRKDAFDEKRYDIPMIEGIVDGIYDIIIKRNKQKLKNQ